ncbi:AraC family transcriptional regulator [Chryseolinea soli]|uniref:AraC family transcriptional regulator n=1 Tax=Chryseolinea soli TaxID=2321403 RepID=A0A385SSM2_9BACT|nr:AraC family transcriptional regulator [Chryseolinea soli]
MHEYWGKVYLWFPRAGDAFIFFKNDSVGKTKKEKLPQYKLEHYAGAHRSGEQSVDFGYNTLEESLKIPGFELYSTQGLRERIGPLKSFFYRIGFTLAGGVSVELGLEKYSHSRGTVNFTAINDIFSLYDPTHDFFGYYMLFTPAFMQEEQMLSRKLGDEYPFWHPSNMHFLNLSAGELDQIVYFARKIDEELHHQKTGRVEAVRMYLTLILLECKRSFERQDLSSYKGFSESNMLVAKFKKLVAEHFLKERHVSDYADRLAVTPNHLNKVIKEHTGLTALENIQEMLLLEAKAQVRHTDQSISEIAYALDFSDPASFNRFFKRSTGVTPLDFRQKA